MFTTIGATMMAVAALSLVGLAIDGVFRHGGEGLLIALGLAAGATVPGWIALSMFGVASASIATWAAYYVAGLLGVLGLFGLMLLWHRQREGFICLGIALVVGAALYAVAPGLISSLR